MVHLRCSASVLRDFDASRVGGRVHLTARVYPDDLDMLPRPHRRPGAKVQELPGSSPEDPGKGTHDYGSPAANAAAQKLVCINRTTN